MNKVIEKKLIPVATKTLSRHTPKKSAEVISFRGASNVSKWFFESVQMQVSEVLPVLKPFPKATVTAEELCGKDFWGSNAVRQRLIGKCLAYAVDIGRLPLEIVNRRKYPLRYRLK